MAQESERVNFIRYFEVLDEEKEKLKRPQLLKCITIKKVIESEINIEHLNLPQNLLKDLSKQRKKKEMEYWNKRLQNRRKKEQR